MTRNRFELVKLLGSIRVLAFVCSISFFTISIHDLLCHNDGSAEINSSHEVCWVCKASDTDSAKLEYGPCLDYADFETVAVDPSELTFDFLLDAILSTRAPPALS
jgi:hypothetical protein